MADEPAAEETAAPEGRINLAAVNFMTQALSAICGGNQTANTALGGQTLGLHTGAPGITGANAAPNSGATAYKPLTWGTPTGGGGAIATVSATAVVFNNVPAGTYSHYGVYNGSGTFLYGKPLSATVTIPTGATGTITVTPSHTYDLL